MPNTFVYAICGDRHVQRVNTSLKFLKKFSKSNIVVIATRCTAPIEHDQVVRAPSAEHLDDHQASIMLKTNLHRIIGESRGRFCYLDSDVVAVNPAVDAIFGCRSDSVCFAIDHTRMRRFSRCAVNCGCVCEECDHLPDAIRQKFDVDVSEADWQHWNGGVYVFDAGAFEFLDTWHSYTRAILTDPMWATRDQGTLIAAAWRHGLQDQVPLPRAFNTIVDKRSYSSNPAEYPVDTRYSLDADSDLPQPRFLHFISGGMGAVGWKNWDDAEAVLRRRSRFNWSILIPPYLARQSK